MKRRCAISLLTLVSLLWQGLAAAAMVPVVVAAPQAAVAAAAPMSEHCRRMMAAKAGVDATAQPHAAAKAATKLVPKSGPKFLLKDCCAGHGHCAAACSVAMLPPGPASLDLALTPTPGLRTVSLRLALAPPPHPFRPPIS